MGQIRRVYVAGAYSADNVLDMLDNIRIGIETSTQVLLAGFSPFCPWLDYHFFLMVPGGSISMDKIKAYSMDWLEASDALLLTPNERNADSPGTWAEVERAEELGIPVFANVEDLKNA